MAELETVRESVRARYAAAARNVGEAGGGCCGGESGCGEAAVITDEQRDSFGSGLYEDRRSRRPPGRGPARLARLRQPDRGRRSPRGRDRPRPRLRRRDRRPALRPACRPDRQGLRARHDRRDARARARQPGRGGTRERRVPQGDDRGGPAARRLGRRDHLQLRDQPLRRQADRLPRGRQGAAPGRPLRRQRRRRRPRHGRGDATRHAAVDRLHRRRAHPGGVRARPRGTRVSRTSRSARPTASTSRRPRRSSAPGWPAEHGRDPAQRPPDALPALGGLAVEPVHDRPRARSRAVGRAGERPTAISSTGSSPR